MRAAAPRWWSAWASARTSSASDVQALIQVTNKIIYLEEDDVVEITRDAVQVYGLDGQPVERSRHESELSADAVERGEYRHYMQKEIFEQPRAVADTLEARLGAHGVLPNIFGVGGDELLARVKGLHIIACGTSYHAGLVAQVLDRGACPAAVSASRWPASTAIATRWCRPIPCSWPFRSPAKPPTHWRRCAKRVAAATWARWPSATCPSPRWCARRT